MLDRALRRLPFLAFTLVLGVGAPPTDAHANDEVHGTRAGELMVETKHRLDVTLDRGHATLRVRRTVHNGIDRHDQAEMWINVPTSAVAVGLRTLGELEGRPHWFSGELMEAEAAAERYRELTGIGGYYPKDPALLSWRSPELLALQVFPVAPKSDKTVEYTLTMPATYEAGQWVVELPALGREDLWAIGRVEGARPYDRVTVDEQMLVSDELVSFDEAHVLSLRPHDPDRLVVRLASVEADADTHLVRLDATAAPRLAEVPHRARVVVLIDESASIDSDAGRAQLEVAKAYLSHFADPSLRASAEVVTFDRRTRRRHERFVDPALAIADLGKLTLREGNGSRVDDALRLAEEILGERARGPARILLLSDLATRSTLDPTLVERIAAQTGAIVHVASVEQGEAMLEPVTAHPWTNVAEHTGGVLWEANAFDGDDVATARRVFEELARPVRLRDLRIAAADIELADVPETLDEGTAYQRLLLHASEVERLEVVGRAWSETVRRRVRPDETFGKRWSALLFGTDLVSELDEREMMVFAVEGGAVSPVTSYLAIEPGVRPSTEGLDWEGSMGFGAGGLGLMGTGSGAGGGVIRNQFDHEAWLADNLRSKVETCAGASRSAKVTLETTLDEIVDIRAVKVDGDDGQELARCVETAMWNLALPGDFDAAFRTFVVDV